MDRALRALLGDRPHSAELREAATLARRAAEAADTSGRPLAAANAALPWPDDDQPHLVLWHASTILREHRGDGHVAALLTHGLDGVAALVSHAAMGAAPEEVFGSRDWSPADWSAARERLTARGWFDPSGALTDHGRASRTAVEHLTDDLAAAPWQTLGPADTTRLAELLMPPVIDIVGAGILPTQSTLGIGLSYT
jgi:hypothetical protein